MTSQVTFFLSLIVGKRFYSPDGKPLGKIKDLSIDFSQERPFIFAAKCKVNKKTRILDFRYFQVAKAEERFIIRCDQMADLYIKDKPTVVMLAQNVFDRQIVDINGRKLVRVNDIRFVFVPSGAYVIAVDVGIDGILRRLGFSSSIRLLLSRLGITIPTRYILWEDIEAFDFTHAGIKLSTSQSKLHKLHPSDLADIIEDMDRKARTNVFSSLDEEKAADVLEEMESKAQVQILESLPLEKAADVLEKMPADEVADLLDELEDEKAESLLNEMEKESSEEVRELLEYSKNEVGSIMTRDTLAFVETMTVEETLNELRRNKPEQDVIYSLFVTNRDEKLVATVSLRNLVISEPSVQLKKIMERNAIFVYDDDPIDSLAEIISKYNLLAIPVTDRKKKLEGMVVIDDIVEDLLDKRKTK